MQGRICRDVTPSCLLMCATEISGDARGGRLALELRRLAPQMELFGLGGDRMRRAGVDVAVDITALGTVGWFDHWRDLPHYVSALRFWRRQVRARRPVAALVIDAPGISYPFARVARAAGIPVVYFVPPQTWLWNPRGTAERLRTHADLVVPTLAAEADIYADAGLPVIYEGHPALDDLTEARDCANARRRRAGVDAHDPPRAPGVRVGLVPGSRRHAVARLLPPMLDALDCLAAHLPLGGASISVASPSLRTQIDMIVARRPRRVRTVDQDLWEVLTSSDVVIASTGGNLLEAVFADVPVVAAYRVDPLTYWIARHVMRLGERVAACALPNLIAGARVVPELIQDDVSGARLAEAAERLLGDQTAREAIRQVYAKVRAALGTPGVNARIAERLLRELNVPCAAGGTKPAG
jgi:lipid-A-disaccharide synthase